MTSEADTLRAAIDLYQAGQVREAERLSRQILDSNPWQPDALHLVGLAAYRAGRSEVAVRYLSIAVAANPAEPDYFNTLGNAFRAQGDVQQARIAYQHALELAPNHAQAAPNLVRLVPGHEPVEETVARPSETAGRAIRGPVRRPLISPLNALHQHRCLFIHVPKNGGTSVKRALDMPGGGHPGWRQYVKYFPEVWKQYTSFAVVRNPWDRAVSAYQHAKVKISLWHNHQTGLHPDHELLQNKSFDECVAILHGERERLQHSSWREQSYFIVDEHSADRQVVVDTLLRFETLAVDFARFCRQRDIPCAELPTANRSQRSRDYRSYYNETTRRMIEDVYRADIEKFGYSFERSRG